MRECVHFSPSTGENCTQSSEWAGWSASPAPASGHRLRQRSYARRPASVLASDAPTSTTASTATQCAAIRSTA